MALGWIWYTNLCVIIYLGGRILCQKNSISSTTIHQSLEQKSSKIRFLYSDSSDDDFFVSPYFADFEDDNLPSHDLKKWTYSERVLMNPQQLHESKKNWWFCALSCSSSWNPKPNICGMGKKVGISWWFFVFFCIQPYNFLGKLV